MIYLDNAATGGHKPSIVKDAYLNAINYLIANPGRSGHRLSFKAEEFLFNTRSALKTFFNAEATDRIIFTKNCTEALNIAILGVLKEGDHVVTTVTEHNSVLRPLTYLASKNMINFSIATPSTSPKITAKDIAPLIKDNTKMIILNGASNVTGTINDVAGIGKLAREKGIYFLVDGAQLAGHEKIDMQDMNIDLLAIAGHKAMYSVMGSGALLFNRRVNPEPIMFGGTGTESFSPQPDCYPERLESGTVNLPAICALYEGVYFICDRIDSSKKRLTAMCEYLISKISTLKGITLYSTANSCGIVAFSVQSLSSMQVTQILSEKYDIAVRGGFHCAPLMHKYLHTDEDGLVRVSMSVFTTEKELNKLYYALKEITFSV